MRKRTTECGVNTFALLVALTIGIGCADAPASTTPEPDMAVSIDIVQPLPDSGIPTLNLEPSQDAPPEFIEIESDLVTAYWVLEGADLLWKTDTGYTHYKAGERIRFVGNDVDVKDAVIADGQLVVTDGVDVFTSQADEFRRSPLSDVFETPIRFKGIDANAFWISDSNGLHHWRSQQLINIGTQTTFDDPSLTWTAANQGVDELLVWHGMSATHLKLAHTTLTEMRYEFSKYPLQIGLSTDGVWTLEATRLFWQDSAQTWQYTDLERSAVGLYTAGTSDTIYVLTDSDVLQIRDFKVGTIAQPASLSHLAVSKEGNLLSLSDGVLTVLSSAVTVNLIGVYEGPLTMTRSLQAQWNERTDPSEITWRLDGVDADQNTGQSEFTLDPSQISPGMHTLSVTALFSGNRTATSDVSFEGPPTWATHVQPIAESQCLNCHDAGAQTELFNQTQWITEFESIQYNVETERMPLTAEKLTSEQIELIKGWGLAEFPQGEGQ